MKIYNIIRLVGLVGVCLVLLISCKDEEQLNAKFEIEESALKQNLDGGISTVTIQVKTTLPMSDWQVESNADWLTVNKEANSEKGQIIVLKATANNMKDSRTAEVSVSSSIKKYVITVLQFSTFEVPEDIQVKVIGGKDSEHQSGRGIENSFDGKFTPEADGYHSIFGRSANFPVSLEYYFEPDTEIDYVIYHTRAGNGNFGQVEVFTATDAGHTNWVKYGDYDFHQQDMASRVAFDGTKRVSGIKFVVYSGYNDFVSCDEMEFFRYNRENTVNSQLLKVFTDLSCTVLKEGITEDAINELPGYFARLALALFNDTYDAHEKEFRIREYAPYSDVEEWANKLMTKKYGNLDNPTGISVDKDDEIFVLVGDTYGQQLSLQVIGETYTDDGEDKGWRVNTSGSIYFLSPGINKLKMNESGQLFVMYTANLNDNRARPINIHIPLGSGKVTGFFDLKEHKTDEKYAQLLATANHKYFCVRGNKIMFYFHTEKLRDFVPERILSAIGLWDDIVGWEQELMGIEDVWPSQMNNHIFAISPEYGYMWASDYRVAFVYTYLNNILLKDNVMADKDNAWGPAHEIGHVHQKAVNWPGCSESSNNLFSNYVLYKLGKYCSRGSELYHLADARFVDGQAWFNMGNPHHMNEDTEIHMRMYWQLWNYYHRCGYNKRFWQTLFQLLREDRIDENDPGAAQLKLAVKASQAAQEDLSDFFELWGFFIPGKGQIMQYGTYDYLVTEEMIEKAKAEMRVFPKPKHTLQYIEDRKAGDLGLDNVPSDVGYYTQFQGSVKPISSEVYYTVNGRRYTVKNGENAVAFELRRGTADGELIYFFNMYGYDIPGKIDLADAKLYAVQADGKRVEVPVR